jgi:hypothetical protein
MGKSKTGAREADLDTYPPNPQTSRHHRPAFRDSVLDDDFCHAGRERHPAGDAPRYFPNILKRPPISVVLAGLLDLVDWCDCLLRLRHEPVRLVRGLFLRYAAPTEPPYPVGPSVWRFPPSPVWPSLLEKSEIDLLVEHICAESDPSKISDLAQKLVDLLQANRQQVPDASPAARPALLRKP